MFYVPYYALGVELSKDHHERTRIFGGRLSASIASYNAGPDAVAGWEVASVEGDDEWVEAIPYDQTRSYVKRVLRSLHAYRVLY